VTVAGATGSFCAAVCAATGAVAGTSDPATTRAAAKDAAPAVVADLISESLRPNDM
jgi:predicted RNase H-like HicB family nuclease